MKPLSGLFVLDLSRILAGPWCTQLLADLGARVVKIEKPGEGDDTRRWGPPFLLDKEGRPTAESAYYLACNRGKESLALDFTKPGGKAVLLKLLERADVLVENFKVGGLAKYGLGYTDLAPHFPKLIYCSITGFGQSGPYASRPGYDAAIQAMGGLMSITGERDDRPGGGPQKVGVAVADLMAGMYAAVSILAALRERDRSGRGCHLDVSLLDCQVAWLANQATNYLIGGIVPRREGTAHPNIVPYQAFACADGHLMLAVGNDAQFARFAALAGHPEWADDPRFATNPARVAHREALIALIAEVMRQRPRQAWLSALEAAGVPAAPINDLAEVFADPQVKARGLVQPLPHPAAGQVALVRQPVLFDGAPLFSERSPPTLGQQGPELLAELGLSAEALARLREEGAIDR
ncbi:MAG: CoA transferase [Lysobacterales bacterium]|jgi:crotonobetainyl-CoA:carnitine CoA-transferase CaiB-like acyl-CoA transferase|nr:MAG: CoA transferase [Xanthomonadales bacterium]